MKVTVFLCAFLVAPTIASASVTRYAVVAGNNRGDTQDLPLRYAESDARRLQSLLIELGGFRAENTVLTVGGRDDDLRRAVIAMNDRIRSERRESVLFVFYSGHADSDALHLDRTRLAVDELRQLVSGSSADVRLLVLDACRSEAPSRLKGGAPEPPFEIELASTLTGKGFAYLTASARGEAAQESDDLGGSFFTHHLISGLRGAADADRNGLVVLDEAYRYAYTQTVRATSRTRAGVQHPSFQYDLSGHGDMVLTTLEAGRGDHGRLSLPPGIHFLLFRSGSEGRVVAEMMADVASRTLTVRAGEYTLLGRGDDAVFEGAVSIQSGKTHRVGTEQLERSEYGRVVRKGYAENPAAVSLAAGAYARQSILSDGGFCLGVFGSAPFELELLTLTPRVLACRESFSNPTLSSDVFELTGELGAARVFDFDAASIDAGGTLGAAFLFQQFETRGTAPARDAVAFVAGFSAGVATVAANWVLRAGVDLRIYVVDRDEGAVLRESYPLVFGFSLGIRRAL